jgi:hypothetical protein
MYTPYGEAHKGGAGVWQINEGPYGPIRMRISVVEEHLTTRMEFLRITTPGFAEVLTPYVDRVVVDATGMKGEIWDGVDWSIPPTPPPTLSAGTGGGPLPASPPSISFQRRRAAVRAVAWPWRGPRSG